MAAQGGDGDMDEAVLEAFIGLLGPLLRALELLAFVARHFDQRRFPELAQLIAGAEPPLRAAHDALGAWPQSYADVRTAVDGAAGAARLAFDGLDRAFVEGDMTAGYRALRHLSQAQEALYALAGAPPVSRYFLDPQLRGDTSVLARLGRPARPGETGVIHLDNPLAARGGVSIYVPENYTPDREWPLVMALHGGSGHGRAFLWSWLRDARAHGAILVAPTSVGRTWALSGPDVDTPHLQEILAHVCGRWRIDEARRLLTGMSDGGTFCYVTGLEPGSPFTHLAPFSASFHPMLAQYADPDRLAGLPIRITHGALDWMFDIKVARDAFASLSAAGADVTLTEIADLSHTYAAEQNAALIGWIKDRPGESAG